LAAAAAAAVAMGGRRVTAKQIQQARSACGGEMNDDVTSMPHLRERRAV